MIHQRKPSTFTVPSFSLNLFNLLPSSLPNRRASLLLLISSVLFISLVCSITLFSDSRPSSSIWTRISGLTSSSSFSLSTQTPPITLYLPFTFGYSMLLQTLHAYTYAGWKHIIVVDNSWDHHAFSQRSHLLAEFPSVDDVIKTQVHLRFAQLQGMMDGYARDRGDEVYLWGHTDVIILPQNGTSPYENTMKCVQMARDAPSAKHLENGGEVEDPPENEHHGTGMYGKIAILFFAYDWLSMVDVKASSKARWDPNTPQYGSDCDRYHRIRLAGYTTADCPFKIGQIIHTHAVLSSSEKLALWESGLTTDEQVAFLADINDSRDQYEWRHAPQGGDDGTEEHDQHDGIGEMDSAAAAGEGSGGREYYEAKWGPFDCDLTGRTPRFDLADLD